MTDSVGRGGMPQVQNFNLRIPTTARQQPQGVTLGQTRQPANQLPPLPLTPTNVQLANPLPPLPPLPPNVQLANAQPPAPPLPQKTHGIIVDQNTTLADLTSHFSGANMKGKTLRLFTHADGTQELHLKNDNKKTNLLSNSAPKKHADAATFVRGVLTRELQSKGIGGEGAAILKAAKVSEKSVAVGDLGKLESRVNNSVRDANRKKGEAEVLRNAVKLDRDYTTWEAQDRGATLAGLATRRQAADLALATTDHAAASAAFCDGSTHADNNKDFGMSAHGGGGVLFVTQTSPQGVKTGVALKIEDPSLLAKADYVSKLGDSIASHVGSPLPFDLPKHELIQLAPNSPERTVLQTKLGEIANGGGPRSDKAQERLNDLNKHGQVSKYELMQGKQLSQLPFEQRAAMVKDEVLPKDFGKSAVLMPMLGLSDHLGLGSTGYTNATNIFLGDDGRLKMIDLDVPDGPGGVKGHTGDKIKESIDGAVAFLKKAAASPDGAKMIADELEAATKFDAPDTSGHPFAGILGMALKSGNIATGSLFSSDTESGAFRSVLTENDSRRFAANVLLGAVEGLEYLRDNTQAFAQAHNDMQPTSAVTNPTATFADINQSLTAANLGQLKTQLTALLQPTLNLPS
jgi:hypothetical protein